MFKFSEAEIQTLKDGLNLAIQSAKRGITSRNPQFTPIYEKIINECEALKLKLSEKPKP